MMKKNYNYVPNKIEKSKKILDNLNRILVYDFLLN